MNIKGHFETITRHKLLVMKYCFACGLYEQGLAHDLSKYSPTEFIPGCIYYQGDHSPNEAEREARGYTSAWLHHKGRNKHHLEYWIDYSTTKTGLTGMKIPLRYVCEMVCDRVPPARSIWATSTPMPPPGTTTSTARTTTCSTRRPGPCWKSCSRWCGTSDRSGPLRT